VLLLGRGCGALGNNGSKSRPEGGASVLLVLLITMFVLSLATRT